MERGNKINVWWLFFGSVALLCAGWFAKPFPIFIFFGLAPLFAILDHTIESESFWENAELILLAMGVYFLSAYQFDVSNIIKILFLAVIFTFPFLGFAYAYDHLGPRTGKFIIIFFWLAIEYIILFLNWPNQFIFLADATQFTKNWQNWNGATGYLGTSAWILLSNWIMYAGVLRGNLNWYLIVLGLLMMGGPIIYSFTNELKPVLRQEMVELYRSNPVSNSEYQAKGELVARTCAWLSLLILLFAFVKSRIDK